MKRGEVRDENTIAVTCTPAIVVAPSGVSHLSSLDRSISHLSSWCHSWRCALPYEHRRGVFHQLLDADEEEHRVLTVDDAMIV
jgi:hypothetical protein